jgi:hypothetical protein
MSFDVLREGFEGKRQPAISWLRRSSAAEAALDPDHLGDLFENGWHPPLPQ